MVKDFDKKTDKGKSTTFENLEFKGLYDFDKLFKVESGEAYILNKEPDVVYMKNMLVTLYLSDDRTVEITSLKGRYNKLNYDCFFEQDVLATDGETFITADNLDMLAEKNIIEIYNNVSLNYPTGTLWADRMLYDFENKLMKITDNNVVKINRKRAVLVKTGFKSEPVSEKI